MRLPVIILALVLALAGCINIQIGNGDEEAEYSDPDMDGDGVLNEDDIDPLVDVWINWTSNWDYDGTGDNVTWTTWFYGQYLGSWTVTEAFTSDNIPETWDWPDNQSTHLFVIYFNTTDEWYSQEMAPDSIASFSIPGFSVTETCERIDN